VKLYWSPGSPYARKAKVVADELGIALGLVRPDLQNLEDSSYGRINPIHRIPALVLDDGTVLPDSKLICDYLDSSKGNKLLPASGPERWRVYRLQVLGDGILDAAVPRRGERARPPEQQSPTRLAQYKRTIDQTVDALEAEADELKGLNLGTIAVGCALGYLDFRFPDEDWRATHPKLAAWFAEFAKRPTMAATVPQG
jgi:glutathione S-transferase